MGHADTDDVSRPCNGMWRVRMGRARQRRPRRRNEVSPVTIHNSCRNGASVLDLELFEQRQPRFFPVTSMFWCSWMKRQEREPRNKGLRNSRRCWSPRRDRHWVLIGQDGDKKRSQPS